MKQFTLQERDVHMGDLVLVNAEHPIAPVFYENFSLRALEDAETDIRMEVRAARVLTHIIRKISANEEIIPVSGYRSQAEQRQIWQNSITDHGLVFTKKYVALPDCSEHQTGLAIDLGIRKEQIDFICPDFPYEGICNRFREQAVKFGYIERYQKSKEAITRIAQEPWHFRYVGYPHSRIMQEQSLCLEEYVEFLKFFSYEQNPLVFRQNGRQIEVSYVPFEGEGVCIEMPENTLYQVSGNNVDGFILTVWRNGHAG